MIKFPVLSYLNPKSVQLCGITKTSSEHLHHLPQLTITSYGTDGGKFKLFVNFEYMCFPHTGIQMPLDISGFCSGEVETAFYVKPTECF
jgi:hypothetical protein